MGKDMRQTQTNKLGIILLISNEIDLKNVFKGWKIDLVF